MKALGPSAPKLAAVSAGLALAACLAATPAAAESRSFAIGWLSPATNSEDNDCPGGPNPGIQAMYNKNLADIGFTDKQIEDLFNNAQDEMFDHVRMRGRVNGEPVSAYAYPAATVDPNWKAITGKYAYGFNLDGRGEATRNGFEDPLTHERGVNNELYRAIGCYPTMRGTLAGRPAFWTWAWTMAKDSQPAWIVTLTGDDLSKDGEITVTFDRALERVRSNPDGEARADSTYRIDSDPRSHNTFKARIKGGVVTVDDRSDLRMLQNPLVAPEFLLKRARMRLQLKDDGTLDGLIGGYQPWSDLYFGFASGGIAVEMCLTGDVGGLYWLMRKHADGDPDPVSGQNTTISATYYIEAVPVFAAPVATATAARK